MYGSIMRARVKKGRRQEYERLLAELVPSAEDYGKGLHSVELAWEDADPDRVVLVIHFRDKESYQRNAQSPDTDREFRCQRELLDGDPEWIDVNYGSYVGKPLSETATVGT